MVLCPGSSATGAGSRRADTPQLYSECAESIPRHHKKMRVFFQVVVHGLGQSVGPFPERQRSRKSQPGTASFKGWNVLYLRVYDVVSKEHANNQQTVPMFSVGALWRT